MSRFIQSRSFACLNLTQFASGLNDNLYKLLLIFFLISLKGEGSSNSILALAGGIYVIPFVLFATLAGTLADRFSKRTIIYLTRLLEILTTSLGIVAFYMGSIWGGYAVLFLMATHSAFFSPCKYGIIPEIVQQEKISRYNGILSATTYLAIILGTFFASFLTEILHKNFTIASFACLLLACVGILTTLGIKKTKAQAIRKKVSLNIFTDIWKILIKARAQKYLIAVIVFEAYFLFLGAYTQLNIIPFTFQSLGLTDVQGGYLFLMTAIGIGLGAFLAGRLSGADVELGFVPLAAMGTTICFLGLYLFDSHLIATLLFLFLVGVCGGFYVVPLDSFIQIVSPNEDRGQNVAATNFLSFIGVILASLLVALLGVFFHLLAKTGFLVAGLISFLIGLLLLLLFADQVLRLLAGAAVKFFWNIRVAGKQRVLKKGPQLLIAPRTSWIDTLIVMATLPRLIRYFVPIHERRRKYGAFYKLLWLFPIDIKHFSSMGPHVFEAIQKELSSGRSVCLMQPLNFSPKNIKEWESGLSQILHTFDVPACPIYILKKRIRKRTYIKVFYGEPLNSHQII